MRGHGDGVALRRPRGLEDALARPPRRHAAGYVRYARALCFDLDRRKRLLRRLQGQLLVIRGRHARDVVDRDLAVNRWPVRGDHVDAGDPGAQALREPDARPYALVSELRSV